MYDITKSETFINASKWLEELRSCAEVDCVIYLVGNKLDLVELNPQLRQVPQERAALFAQENNLYWEETSAITNIKVKDVFEKLIHCN